MDDGPRTPQFAFVIDQRKCIGCHACTVACKSENEVPLAKFRTWVKYVDKGTFPAVRRHFTVLRCNHCDEAPCVDICPVNALHKRKDAIVDLDRDLCIGCRGCMQACPYDALYLNEDTGVAEKCHFCAHRTELGLEPACVVVCPERAIVAGDLSDPGSEIATLVREQPTSRRKLEKGTKPRVFYVDALSEALRPGEAVEPKQWLWSNRQVQPPPVPAEFAPPPDVMTTLNVDHPPVWGWHIWTYLLTKNVAAGAGMAAPFVALLGVAPGFARDHVPEVVALVFLAVTTFLLVHDLGRPERFLKLVFQPNTKSWLVKGAWILMAFGGLATAAIAFRALGMTAAADVLRWANLPFAVLASGYSAWLFAQCRGRDLWLDRALFWKLVVKAGIFGAGLLLLLGPEREAVAEGVFAVFAFLAWFLEIAFPVRGGHAPQAHRLMAKETEPGVWLGLVVATLLVVASSSWFVTAIGVALAAAAMFVHERAWVRAGQAIPIS